MPTVTIIYNPNSTGDGKRNAQTLKDALAKHPSITTILKATEYAGHAEEIAYEIASKNSTNIIISSSGDGGYNEVINGVLSTEQNPASHPIVGVLASGNANDHYHALTKDSESSITRRITQPETYPISVLKLTSPSLERYAHSYIGFGVTPHIGSELTKAKLNPINEIFIVLRHLFTVHPIKIRIKNHNQRYDNIIFSIIPKMSKVLKVGDQLTSSSKRFTVVANKHTTFFQLFRHLIRGATRGFDSKEYNRPTSFILKRATDVQLDGEVYTIKANEKVTIERIDDALQSVT